MTRSSSPDSASAPPLRGAGSPVFLHVGCGSKRKQQTTQTFAAWNEIRLDIDPSAQPDVTGTMTDMAAVASGSVQAVFSSHNIEHLYPHEVLLAPPAREGQGAR